MSFLPGTYTLSSTQLEQLADLVADRLLTAQQGIHAGPEHAVAVKEDSPLLTAEQLSGRLGVGRRWIYEHARELGGQRLGDGPKARLRFDLKTAQDAMARFGSSRSQAHNPHQQAKSEAPRRRRTHRLPNGLPDPSSVLAVRGRRA
ncbi:MAG: hypothetical protein WAU69_03035 [Solirubrobacteraceae bacterium]